MALRRSLWFGLLAVASLLWVCPSTGAGDNYVGVYQCASLVVDGRSGRCTSPPLVLHADGTYKIWGEQGTYRIDGNQLKLSESKKHGRGRLLRGRQIVFKFSHRGKKHKVTFRRSDPFEVRTAIVVLWPRNPRLGYGNCESGARTNRSQRNGSAVIPR